MPPKTKREFFRDWCKKNNLTPEQAYSMMFVTPGAADDFFASNDIKYSTVKIRLWSLTSESFFKPTTEQIAIYEKNKSKSKPVQCEEKISTFLIDRWKGSNTLPSHEESLVGKNVTRKKVNFIPILMEKFFGEKVNIQRSQPQQPDRKTGTSAVFDFNGKDLETKILALAAGIIEQNLESSESHALEFKDKNLSELKRLSAASYLFMDKNPYQAKKSEEKISQQFKERS